MSFDFDRQRRRRAVAAHDVVRGAVPDVMRGFLLRGFGAGAGSSAITIVLFSD
jgi:hypothetical protein